jgi:hypothetical protein
MKDFLPVTFDYAACEKEVKELADLLATRSSLKESRDILPFFKARPQLSALCGHYNPNMGRHDRVAWEYDLFGDFACDVAVGDSVKQTYTFLEFEDAGSKSLFTRQGKKATREWSARFDHGYSQIIDWFYKLNDERKSDAYNTRFGKSSIDFVGVLVVGRDRFLEPGERLRLEWRRENVVVQSKRVVCLTFDELARDLAERLRYFALPAKTLGKRQK